MQIGKETDETEYFAERLNLDDSEQTNRSLDIQSSALASLSACEMQR